jgi:hypothetical protein
VTVRNENLRRLEQTTFVLDLSSTISAKSSLYAKVNSLRSKSVCFFDSPSCCGCASSLGPSWLRRFCAKWGGEQMIRKRLERTF